MKSTTNIRKTISVLNSSQRGFTLIELMLATAILIILVGGAVPIREELGSDLSEQGGRSIRNCRTRDARSG